MIKDNRTGKVVLNPREAAEYLGISKVTLYKLLKSGEVPAKKFGNQWRISKAILDEFLTGSKEK
jgi:excisionase family DNA binding protein